MATKITSATQGATGASISRPATLGIGSKIEFFKGLSASPVASAASVTSRPAQQTVSTSSAVAHRSLQVTSLAVGAGAAHSSTSSSRPAPAPSRVTSSTVVAVPASNPGFARVQTAIRSLDLDHSELSIRIEEIDRDLKRLQAEGNLSEEQYRNIRQALIALKAESFQASKAELDLLNTIAKTNAPLRRAMERSFRDAERQAARNARSDLLRALKGNVGTLGQLADAASTHFKRINTDMPKARFRALPSLTSVSPFNRHFIDNLPILIQAVEEFTGDAQLQFRNSYTAITRGVKQLEAVIEKYGVINPMSSDAQEIMLNDALQAFVMDMGLDSMNTLDTTALKSKIHAHDSVTVYIDAFRNYYGPNCFHQHIWISRNFSKIKHSCDQSLYKDSNLGDGTCHANSLDRIKYLRENPDTQSSLIPMRSSQSGRVAQARTIAEIHGRIAAGATDPRIVGEIQDASSSRLNLELAVSIPVTCDSAAPIPSVISILNGLTSSGRSDVDSIFTLRGPDGAHAMNVQIIPSKGIYRVMDDNFGVWEAASYAEFQTAFRSYLETFYSKDTSFAFDFFT